MPDEKFKHVSYGNALPSDPSVCFYCNCKVNTYNRTVDHMHPRSLGGIKANDNKCYACLRCNNEKSDQTIEQWLTHIAKHLAILKQNKVKLLLPNINKRHFKAIDSVVQRAIRAEAARLTRIKYNLEKTQQWRKSKTQTEQ